MAWGFEYGPDHPLHLVLVVEALGVQLVAQVQHNVGVADAAELCRGVVLPEGSEDLLPLVDEVHHEGGVLARVGAVQPRQGLHGLDAAQLAVHVHGAQQRLVETSLELIGHQQDAELRRGEGLAQVAPLKAWVHVGFGEWVRAAFRVVHLAREGDQQADAVALPPDVVVHRAHPAHRLLAARGDHHRLGLPTQQVRHVLPEVLHHDLHAGGDVDRVQAHPAHDAFLGCCCTKLASSSA